MSPSSFNVSIASLRRPASRLVLLLAAAVGAAFAIRRLTDWWSYYEAWIALSLTAGVVAFVIVLGGSAVRAHSRFTQRLALEIVLMGTALILVEAAVTARPEGWTEDPVVLGLLERQAAARRLGVPFDTRSPSQVVADLRAQGIDALPSISHDWARIPEVRAQLPDALYPLSQASHATIVECNEGGEYLVYRTDEFGFNNPPGLLTSGIVDVAVIGDSHAVGHCVKPEESFVHRIRTVHRHTANFGLAGPRVLAQLGSLREYVTPYAPRVVVWTLNTASLAVAEELADPVLARYLDPRFSQGLRQRQAEIDPVLRRVAPAMQTLSDARLNAVLATSAYERFRRVPLLPQIRARLGPPARPSEAPADAWRFLNVLSAAQSSIHGWGGQLIVVLTPNFDEVVGTGRWRGAVHEDVARRIEALGIDVLDGAALFQRHPDPTRLFTLHTRQHPNGEGYARLADAVLAKFAAHVPYTRTSGE